MRLGRHLRMPNPPTHFEHTHIKYTIRGSHSLAEAKKQKKERRTKCPALFCVYARRNTSAQQNTKPPTSQVSSKTGSATHQKFDFFRKVELLRLWLLRRYVSHPTKYPIPQYPQYPNHRAGSSANATTTSNGSPLRRRDTVSSSPFWCCPCHSCNWSTVRIGVPSTPARMSPPM